VTTTSVRSDLESLGVEMHGLIRELFPICRSITGDGVRQTLEAIRRYVPLDVHEVPSGTQVLDWTVPPEWNVRDAYVADATGRRVIDFQRSNLHLVSYSAPVRERMSRAELDTHLFSLPDHPDWIPYRTSYYDRTWGFCVTDRQRRALPDGEYDVVIDATLEPGHLSYGECYLPGARRDEEVLISCHVCHPSLANDNLSGLALTTFLARHLAAEARQLSYRFLWIPGAIGSITWLSRNDAIVPRVKHGLVVTCVGDRGPGMTYKKSRRGNADVDRAAQHVLSQSGRPFTVEDFIPWGYDERQYCSPGFDMPVGSLMRTPNGRYPEYHSSADDVAFVDPKALGESLATYAAVLHVLDRNRRYLNQNPKGEPQLGRRGIYTAMADAADAKARQMAMLWVLNLSDGAHSLLDIAERSATRFELVAQAADLLLAHGLLVEADERRDA
jgi:aminopeptidase-like protein